MLDERRFLKWKIMELPPSLFESIFFDGVFKYGDVAKFWGYVEINTKPLFVEFFNFVQHFKLLSLLLLNLIKLFSIGMIMV
jgi:hypothetical protein